MENEIFTDGVVAHIKTLTDWEIVLFSAARVCYEKCQGGDAKSRTSRETFRTLMNLFGEISRGRRAGGNGLVSVMDEAEDALVAEVWRCYGCDEKAALEGCLADVMKSAES